MAARDVRAGKAYVELGVRDRLARGLAAAQARLRSFAAGAARVGAATAGAGAAILSPFALSVNQFMKTGDELDKMAARTGLSVEALSELGFAASRSGTDLSKVEDGVKGMQRQLLNLEKGSSRAAFTFEQLGLSLADLQGMTPEQQFERIAGAIAGVEDPSKQAALAMSVFGDSGAELLPMVRDMDALRAKARELGVTMSGEDATAAAKLTDAWGDAQMQIGALMKELGAAVAGPLTEALRVVTRLGVQVINWASENRGLILTVAAVGAGLVAAGTIISGIAALAMGASVAIGGITAAAGAASGAIALLVSPLGLLTAATAIGTVAWLRYSHDGQQALERFRVGFENYKAVGMDAFRGIKAALSSGDWGAAAEIAMTAIQAAWDQGVADLMAVWGDYIRAVVETFAGAMGAISKLWVETQGGISKGILSLAQNEGIVGDVMAKLLGVDMRKQNERSREIQQAGLDRRLEEQTRQRDEAAARGDVETVAEWDRMIAETRRLLGREDLGVSASDPFADAQQTIDDQTAAQTAAIDDLVAGTLNRFDDYTSGAAERAEEARARLAAQADQAETDLELKRALEEDFEPPEINIDLPNMEGVDVGLNQASQLPTLASSSSYAIQALAGNLTRGRGPEEETAHNTRVIARRMLESTREIKKLERLGFA